MKKALLVISIILAVIFLGNIITMATDAELYNNSEESYDDSEEYFYDEYNYNPDDYDSIMEEGYTQEELKQYYEEYRSMLNEMYNTYERKGGVRARVVSVEGEDTNYTADAYAVYENRFQKVKVNILEGDYRGQEMDMDYYLTADALGNIIIPKLSKGDIINVYLEDAGNGNINGPYIISIDTAVQKRMVFVSLGIIALALLAIYGGKKGLSMFTVSVMAGVLIFMTITPGMIEGIDVLLLTTISSILIVCGNVVLRRGLNERTILALISTIIVVAFSVGLLYGFDYISRIGGNTFEATLLSENIIRNNINFHNITLAIAMLGTAIIVSDIACKVAKKAYEHKDDENKIEKILNESRSIIADRINLIVILLLSMIIPKYLLLIAYKYSFMEIINSEMLIIEVSRIFIFIIAMCIIVPVTAILGGMFFKKEKVKEENVQDK